MKNMLPLMLVWNCIRNCDKKVLVFCNMCCKPAAFWNIAFLAEKKILRDK